MIVLTNSVTIPRSLYDPPTILAFIFKRSHNQTSDLHSYSDIPPVMMKHGWFDYGFFQPHKIHSRFINVLTFTLQPPNFKYCRMRYTPPTVLLISQLHFHRAHVTFLCSASPHFFLCYTTFRIPILWYPPTVTGLLHKSCSFPIIQPSYLR